MTTTDFLLYRLNASSEAEMKSAVDVLLAAYTNDRAIEALSAGDKSAAALLFRRSLEAALEGGECYLAYCGDVICGVSAWVAPGKDWRFQEDLSFISNLPQQTQEWYSQHYIPKYEDLYRCGGLDSTKARREAWKLERLGVLPQHRNKGVGRALLQVVCSKVDRDKTAIVTDATNPSQVNYLQRLGFQYRAVKNMMCGSFPGFPIWCLVREPGSSLIENRRGSAQSHLNPKYTNEHSPRRSP